MKLKTLIEKLEKARLKYLKKHGAEPVLWGWDYESESTLCLCKGEQRKSGGTVAKKPYSLVKVSGLSDRLS